MSDEWEDHVRESLFPRVRDANITLSLCPAEKDEPDVKFCLELGAAIMFDKPILALHMRGAKPIPNQLRKVATVVVEDFHFDDEAKKDELRVAIEEMVHRSASAPPES